MRSSMLTRFIKEVVSSLSARSTTSRCAGSCLRTKKTKQPVSIDALYNTVGAAAVVESASTNRAASS